MLYKYNWFLILMVMVFTAGCATLQENQASVKVTVQYATLKVINDDKAKAERVVEIMEKSRVVLSQTAEVSINQAVNYIRDQINLQKLDLSDRLLITAVLDQVEMELIKRFGTGILAENQKQSLDILAQWIADAARLVQ